MMPQWILAIALAVTTPAPPSAPLPEPDAVMAVPAELRERLQREVLTPHDSRYEQLENLVRFMFEPGGLGITYRDEPTTTVAETWATRQTNCLGFTLMFLALAREAGLDAYPQEIGQTLNWREQDQTVFRSMHVNAGVRVGGLRYTVDVAANRVIGLRPPERISEARLIAHYYGNLAIESLARGDYADALTQVRRSLAVNAESALQWSNAGVIELRNGDLAAAGEAYARALELDARESGALFNLVSYYRRLGDSDGERRMRERLERIQRQDPFHHFLLASDYERRGDYEQAIAHYQRAIRWRRDEPRFHLALANAYRHHGDLARAEKSQARAHSLERRARQREEQARAAVN